MKKPDAREVKYPRLRVSVIIIEDERILLVRHEKSGRSYWVLPGGGVDFGETLEEAAVRELKEETNLDITLDRLVFADDILPKDLHRHVVDVYFTAKVVGGELRLGQNSVMHEVRFFPLEEFRNLPFEPNIADRIIEGYKRGFPDSANYLGNMWE
jgi:8-oxo-dGTP diphosphatase